MRTEHWIKGHEVVIANVQANGKITVGNFTWYDYVSFVTDMAMYGYTRAEQKGEGMELKDLLKKYRNDHALTQSDMAWKVGINRSLYNQIENGKEDIGNRTIQKIAKLLKVAPDNIVELLKGE